MFNTNQHDPKLIEQIVREVIVRLRANNSVPRQDSQNTPARATNSTLKLTQKVITLQQLTKLDNVTQIQVPSSAVVTPSVHDELRQRKIKLIKGDHHKPSNFTSNVNPNAQTIHIGALEPDLEQLKQHFSKLPQYKPEITTAKRITHLCQNVSQKIGHRQNIILIVPEPFNAACQSNRNSNLRAASVRDETELAAAKKEINANTIIINNRSLSLLTPRFINTSTGITS